MNIANEAIANSIQCEIVKYAYRQTKDGIVVSFVVHPDDIPAALSTSRIGSRFVAVLVQVGDDELPVHQPAKETKHVAPATPRTDPKPAGAKRDWRDIPPPQQAGIRCDEPAFAAYLKENFKDDWHEAPDATECVRLICGVESRSELATNQKARVIWHQLDTTYQAWKALEHA